MLRARNSAQSRAGMQTNKQNWNGGGGKGERGGEGGTPPGQFPSDGIPGKSSAVKSSTNEPGELVDSVKVVAHMFRCNSNRVNKSTCTSINKSFSEFPFPEGFAPFSLTSTLVAHSSLFHHPFAYSRLSRNQIFILQE